jgi:hypothetical protein
MICVYLAALCAILIVTSAFLTRMQDAVAVTAAGLFGLLLSGGLGFAFWWSQRRDLLYLLVPTSSDPRTNFQAVRAAVHDAGWLILREDPARRLEAQAIGSSMNPGERVAVQFRDNDVLIASICDPSVGFSLVGRRRCREHRELVRRAVLSARQE